MANESAAAAAADLKKPGGIYPRLQLAYLLQFAIWGSWSIALGAYLAGKLQEVDFCGVHMGTGWIYNAYPIGVILAALFIGPLADRLFSAQKVLGLLQIINGLALVTSGYICKTAVDSGEMIPFWPLMILMLVSGMCFLPSIPLINAVVFKHIPNKDKAPNVFIFGTIGWILVNLIIECFCGGATTPNFFFLGGGIALFYGFYAYTLPNTPPKGKPAEGEKSDALGLGAFALFKDWRFTCFLLCAFLVSIFGSNFYFPALGPYLVDHGYPAPVALGTFNQFSELIFMALLAVAVARIGLKWVLVLGMAAWAVRYILFTQEGFSFAVIAILLHGMAYAFLYTASYMFGDKVAPDNLKASVQALLAFLLLGVGQLLSGVIYDVQMSKAAPKLSDEIKEVAPLAEWSAKDSNLKYLELAKSLKYAMGEKNAFNAVSLANYTDENGVLTAEGLTKDKIVDLYPDDENFQKALKGLGDDEILLGSYPNFNVTKIDDIKKQITAVEAAQEEQIPLDRDTWLKVERRDWKKFFTYPAYFVIFWTVFFVIFGREPKAAEAETAKS
ncbi:MAG: MFS transporter [Thermoguttaceae bacterium]|jgi:MFS family permease